MNRNKNPSNKENIFTSFKAYLLLKLRPKVRLLATPEQLFRGFSWCNEHPVQRGVVVLH